MKVWKMVMNTLALVGTRPFLRLDYPDHSARCDKAA